MDKYDIRILPYLKISNHSISKKLFERKITTINSEVLSVLFGKSSLPTFYSSAALTYSKSRSDDQYLDVIIQLLEQLKAYTYQGSTVNNLTIKESIINQIQNKILMVNDIKAKNILNDVKNKIVNENISSEEFNNFASYLERLKKKQNIILH